MKNVFFVFCLGLSIGLFGQASLNMIEVGAHDTGSVDYNDVWGYVHDDKEYIVYGARDKIAIVDVTDCSNPIEEAVIDDGNSTIWRDFKDYGDYVYGVCDQGSEGLEIVNKDDYSFSQITDFPRAHNIFIDVPNGRLYVAGSRGGGLAQSQGLLVYDVAADEANPPLIGEIDFNDFDNQSGFTNWYVHDVYVRDNIAYCSHGNIGTYGIWDMSDLDNVALLGSSLCDGLGDYNHSSWVTEDLKYAYIAEEVPQKSITILDISDVTDIQYLGQFSDPLLTGASTPPRAHNPFIRADLLYISYYHDGVKVYDISEPENPIIEAYYDTADGHTSYGGYIGAWGIYPYLPSGCIGVSDIEDGLLLLEHEVATTSTITDADLLFDDISTGLLFRKNADEYGRLRSGPNGEIVVQGISGIPVVNESLKRSNLYIDNSSKGIVYNVNGKIFRIQVSDIGNVTNNFIGTTEPTPVTRAQSTNIVINSVGSSLIMKSPNGTCWRININSDNMLVTESISCP